MNGFTRQETIALTKTTSSRLAYLDRVGVVVPEKYGNTKKPMVIYSWEQVLQIRAINDLRKQVSLQAIREIIQSLEKNGYDSSLWDKHLVTVNGEIHWVMPDWSDIPKVMQLASKKNKSGFGQLVLVAIPTLNDIVKAVWHAAKTSKVIDFESFRRRAKPAQAA
jgi:DNA-binding transcriptional MerR regulator